MIVNKLIKQCLWQEFMLNLEMGEQAVFKVKDVGQISSIRTIAGRINTRPDRTFRISVRANRETRVVNILTGPII